MAVFKILSFMVGFGLCFSTKNVLFLMVDDLRPQLGAYAGDYFPSSVSPDMVTPNIDALASRSLLLQRAYVQQAMCGPSRASFLTGRRPDTTHVYDLKDNFRDVGGNFTTIPQYFKENGYSSVGIGKIFHPGSASGDDPYSWSEYFQFAAQHEDTTRSWYAVNETELAKKSLRDRKVANKAIEKLQEFDASGEKFFLAVGFHKPHDPFVFPDTYLDFYPEEDINVPNNAYAPTDLPEIAWNPSTLIRKFDDIKATGFTGDIGAQLPDGTAKELRRAYYATVTWIDSLVGEILDEIERLGLSDNTVVSFASDHGYMLGENGQWGKRTNFELATHAPLMIHIPGRTDSGVRSDRLVEFVDIFPTIVEASELGNISPCPDDSSTVELCHEGTSLLPLITAPDTSLKDAAFSQAESPQPGSGRIMGYTMRTDRYRYTEWATFRYAPVYAPNWKKALSGVELYDHENDPYENTNLAYESSFATLRDELSTKLRAGWTEAVVDSSKKRFTSQKRVTSKKRFLDELISWLYSLDDEEVRLKHTKKIHG